MTEQTNEVLTNQDAQKYQIVKDENGKFKRIANYKSFASVKAETREQKVALFNLMRNEGTALPMNDHVNEVITISDVIFQPYDSVNEDTGELENGVVTYIITPDGKGYVTSSKSVYFTLESLFLAFGRPHYNEEEQIDLKIVKKKGTQFKYIDVEPQL